MEQGLAVSFEDAVAWVGQFYWSFLRISALFVAAPLFGARLLPVRVRVLFAALLSVMLMPLVGESPALDPLGGPGLLLALREISVGVIMGFGLQMLFQAAVIAGENIAMTMGLGFAATVDPASGLQVPVVSQFFLITVTLLFLALDGHLALLVLLVDSFSLIPLTGIGLAPESWWQMLAWGTRMYQGAALVALPAVTALLVTHLALGVLTRAAPQLNIFSVGFSITLLGGFLLVLWIMPAVAARFSELLAELFRSLPIWLRGG